MNTRSRFLVLAAITASCGVMTQQHVSAKSSTPDTSTSASNKPAAGGGGGGGGGGSSSTAAAVLLSGPVTFVAAGLVNGVLPVCTGDYRIQAYYPALLDMSVNISVSSLNVPDGTVLYVNTVNTGYSYPYTANSFVVTGGAGICTEKLFVGLGVGLSSVTITDGAGNIVFAGK